MGTQKLNYAKIRGYAIANILLAFINEFDHSERIGPIALFYNKLTKKDNEFKRKQQEFAVKYSQALKKHKPLPKKSQALKHYEIAHSVAAEAWKMSLSNDEISKMTISINAIFQSFWVKERDILTLLYDFKDEDFKEFVAFGTKGHSFTSLKMTNILITYMDDALNALYTDTNEKDHK